MKQPDSEELLDELLAADDQEAFRQATLAHGLTALRQRSRQRRMIRVGGVAAVSCLLAVGFIFLRSHDRATTIASNPAKVAAPSVPGAVHTNDLPPIKIINDEELFALFPDRPLALVGKSGHQQLVFLDRPAASSSE